MENTNKLESGFKINNLILVESSFHRINNVSFEGDIDRQINIDTNTSVNGNIITVSVEVMLLQKLKDIEEYKIKVRMIGVFENIGETPITNFEEFGKVNGAAIIFPYIREHITSLSLKAGIGTIVLPPMNFTKTKKGQ